MKYQLITTKQINIQITAMSVFLAPPLNANKGSIGTGAIVNNTVNETQTENTITSTIIYSPIHYTYTQAVVGVSF
jgi:hypothetical protein